MCIRTLSVEEQNSKVAEWVVNGFWDLSRLHSIVSSEVLQRLVSSPTPMQEAGDDVILWNGTHTGIFTVKSAYHLLDKPDEVHSHKCFKLIWKWLGVERIRVFMWLAFLNRLPSNERRSKWSSSSPFCQHCHTCVESTIHILRDCIYASNMWRALIQPRYYFRFFASSMTDWFILNFSKDIGRNQGATWNILFGVGIWRLWNWRNDMVFNSHFVKPRDSAAIILYSWHFFAPIGVPLPGSPQESIVNPSWQLPPLDWLKANVDGAVSTSNNKAGCGGVLRDHYGKWIKGFS
ncbi:hypothetical protein QN277_014330 [Acacia crassicarpa]|uniref:Reverse transcriptase zinc-binding domain-containing protein n=1 Tax=Acacia crassicarpa TaxID=499986 RepID=A0AAE1M7Y9_9FABA|nr:hypothetical protein QN277_014330 [Acacia crassicarpa]